jgi:cellulose synthase/poly-beta-1,6-N-acetylglucosamine synthase-like glycosyltransferase
LILLFVKNKFNAGKVSPTQPELLSFVIMILLACCLFGLSLAYLLLCSWLLSSWKRMPVTHLPPDYIPHTFISVIIAARNEEAGIIPCVLSVLHQHYPEHLFELIVVNDHSDDQTVELLSDITDPRLHVIHLADHLPVIYTKAHKKKAIELGVSQARGTWILHTDADCVAPANWLFRVAHYAENHPAICLLGAVMHHQERHWLQRFQSLDLCGLMLCTGALCFQKRPLLANGASLAYAKAVFTAVEGYQGIDHLASGDDLLLVHKIAARYPGGVHFLKHPEQVVRTPAMPDLPALIAQRTRWATKTNQYQHPVMRLVLGSIFMLSLAILLLPLLSPLSGSLAPVLLSGGLFAVKALADYRLLRHATRFYQRPNLLHPFLLMELLHIVYMVSTGILGLTARRYVWKGRLVR